MSTKTKRVACLAKKLPPNSFKKWERAFCQALDKVLAPELDNGFSPYVLTKFSTGEKNLAGVIWRLNQKQRPRLLNFCPFCGTSFAAWLAPHLKKETVKPGKQRRSKAVADNT